MAQPTAQNFETPKCRKIDDGNHNNSANTDIYAYSETSFSVWWAYYRLCDDKKLDLWVLSFLTHLGHMKNGQKKTVSKIGFVNHIK